MVYQRIIKPVEYLAARLGGQGREAIVRPSGWQRVLGCLVLWLTWGLVTGGGLQEAIPACLGLSAGGSGRRKESIRRVARGHSVSFHPCS